MATNVSAPLPELTLMPGSVITVSDSGNTAPVTSLVIKMFQVTPEDRPAQTSRPLLLRTGR